MAKGYWVARVDVRDAESYKDYVAANGAAFAKFGGRFLVRGGTMETVAGTSRARNVVLEFPSYQAALDCWRSSEYQEAKALDCWRSSEYQEAKAKQKGGADMDVIVIEGYDGPQPGSA